MDELKLYYLPTCPYSLKVLHFIRDKDIPLELRATTEPEHRDFLLAHGGKNQVPCLFIGESPLYESDDIIAYLDERF
ncbi:MAG: glutathione S-transferase N-terminal domain-containing protein [Coriobacteriales bacterium]|jgi:glutathione S-transferase|nr:glutathione S-transferase N-terminal domain-containing protein [Coriobacteriales bacterium]